MTIEKKSKSSGETSCCPCCGYKMQGRSPYADRSGIIEEGCRCCGFQFGRDENVGACGQAISLAVYRTFWIKDGCRWFHGNDTRPKNWSIAAQLAEAGIPFERPGDIRKSI